MDENITKILKMVQEGKIDADKAAELIEAINSKSESKETKPRTEKMLKIKVVTADDTEKVNVRFPIKFIKASLKAFGKIPINIEGDSENKIDMQAISDAIENEIDGKIVECCTKKGDNVEIVIE